MNMLLLLEKDPSIRAESEHAAHAGIDYMNLIVCNVSLCPKSKYNTRCKSFQTIA